MAQNEKPRPRLSPRDGAALLRLAEGIKAQSGHTPDRPDPFGEQLTEAWQVRVAARLAGEVQAAQDAAREKLHREMAFLAAIIRSSGKPEEGLPALPSEVAARIASAGPLVNLAWGLARVGRAIAESDRAATRLDLKRNAWKATG